jgi:hypothetical protein
MGRFAASSAVAGMIGCLIAFDASAQSADPLFANKFEPGLIAFGPSLSEVPSGAFDQQSTGTPLHVTLAEPAPAPTWVSVVSTDPSIVTVSGGGVIVPAGATSAPVKFSTPFVGTSSPVTIWAILGNTVGAAVYVSYASSSCIPGLGSDMSGYTRQCSGYASNYQGDVTWDNTYATLLDGIWPGNVQQVGHAFRVKVNATQYGSFLLTTGATATGIHIYPNNSVGATGMASVSTEAQGPGQFPTGLCHGSDLTLSTKSVTQAQCKLASNSTYYLNISMASSFSPYPTTCATTSCITGWAFDQYDN